MNWEHAAALGCCPLPGLSASLSLVQTCEVGSAGRSLLVFCGVPGRAERAGAVPCDFASGELLLAVEGPLLLHPASQGTVELLELSGAAELLRQLGEGAPLWSVPGTQELLGQAQALLLHSRAGRWHSLYEASAALFTLLMAVGERMAAPPDAQPLLIRQAVDCMRGEYARLSGIEELAERLGVSKSHLIRRFRAVMGCSPGQYLQRVRIEQAQRLLENLSERVETVAALVGFSGANYFCRVFRQETGQSPGSYRQQRREVLPLEAKNQRRLDEFYVL